MAASTRFKDDIARYRQVESILREQILDGTLGIGDRLPAERTLLETFGISRGTLRQALDTLERDRLIDREPGRGTFVRSRGRQSPPSRPVLPWQGLIDQADARATRLTHRGSGPAPTVVTAAFGLDRERDVAFFIRLSRERGDKAIGLKRYLHPDHADVLAPHAAAGDFGERLDALGGHRLGRVWIEAIRAEPRFAMQLGVPLGAPLLSLWWIDLLNGQAALCSQMILSGASAGIALREDIADGL